VADLAFTFLGTVLANLTGLLSGQNSFAVGTVGWFSLSGK